MEGRQPSSTAFAVAGHRAAHQVIDNAFIFKDPFARLILDEEALAQADERAQDPAGRHFRLFVAARSRFVDDCLAAEMEGGLRQVAVLGAGLDTFGLRNPYRNLGLRVFEVDHPATQMWKRERLSTAGLDVPAELVFVPVDFECEDVAERLSAEGFRHDRAAFYIWLGVVPYLERRTVFSLLRFAAAGPEAGIVFDYSEPLENYAPDRRARAEAMAARAAAAGEPWITLFNPTELSAELNAIGFQHIEDLGPGQTAARYFGVPARAGDNSAGPHILFARTTPPAQA